MVTIVLGLLVLSLLVVFHELGHFWVARRLGVRVERFSIGFGPVLLSRRHHDVEYVVSAFPLGGYVKMGGDDPRNRENLKPGDFFHAAWWRRVIIALAGPGANFLLAVLLSVVLLWTGFRIPDAPNLVGEVGPVAEAAGFRNGDRIVAVNGTPVASMRAIFDRIGEVGGTGEPVAFTLDRNGSPVEAVVTDLEGLFQGLEFPIPAEVGEVHLGFPAYKEGITAGDRIIAIDGEPIEKFTELQEIVERNAGVELLFSVERDGKVMEVPITPIADMMGDDPVGKVGITAASTGTYLVRMGFLEGMVGGVESTVNTVGFMIGSIVRLFSDVSNLKQISGPVAIIQASGNAAQAGVDRLLDRAILFSVALMVFNLLPIPILDGGMVMLSLLEGIRRRPVGEKGLALYQGIGLAVMGTLLVFVLINDPLRILQRRSALGRMGDLAP